MGMELLGILASFATVISGFGWMMDRSAKRSEKMLEQTHHAITKVENNLSDLNQHLQELKIELPTNFVTKQELLNHIQGEERWHEKTTERLREIQEELTALRYRSHS